MIRAGALALGVVVLASCATGAPSGSARVEGYLKDDAVERLADAPPSPRAPDDDNLVEASMDRWWLAIVHAELRPPEAAQHFDCVLGTRLLARPRPALTRLLDRLAVDAVRVTEAAAKRHPRSRLILNPAIEPCQRVTEAVRRSPSWPAGGAVVGAAFGEAFAALAPGRADAARRAGREIGLSRTVCRMNRPSEVADGAALGRAVYAQSAETPAFGTDLEAAREEVAQARAEGLTNPGCAAERRAYGDPSWGVRPGAG